MDPIAFGLIVVKACLTIAFIIHCVYLDLAGE